MYVSIYIHTIKFHQDVIRDLRNFRFLPLSFFLFANALSMGNSYGVAYTDSLDSYLCSSFLFS